MRALVLAALLCATTQSVAAADLDYSYLDVGYSSQKADLNDGGRGYSLEADYAFTNHLFVEGLYQKNSFNDQERTPTFLSGNFDVKHVRLGIGAHGAPLDHLDIYAILAVSNTDLDANYPFSYSFHDSKASSDFVLGMRTYWSDSFEFDASFESSDNAHITQVESHGALSTGIDGHDSAFRLGTPLLVHGSLQLGAKPRQS